MSEIENQLLRVHNQMFMSPEDFSYRWGVGYEDLAEICCLSKSTTYHWFGGRASRRRAGRPYQRILAMADFFADKCRASLSAFRALATAVVAR